MTDFFSLNAEVQAQRMEQAAQEALPEWGLGGASLALIKYRENAVYEVQHANHKAALRVHRPDYHSAAALTSELQWMAALNEAGIATPQVVPTQSGQPFATVAVQDTAHGVHVDIFQWIEGSQLGSVEEGLSDSSQAHSVYKTIGVLAARVHNQAQAWQRPEGFERRSWDEDGLAGAQPLWGRFWELEGTPAQTELLKKVKQRLLNELSALPKTPDQYGLIHADLVPENLMVSDGAVQLIDFDDAGWGWHMFELATALYFIQGEDYFKDAKAGLIAGYRQYRALPDDMVAQLPLFMLARGTTYLGWVQERKNTQTAKELTPMLLDMACGLAEDYLAS